MKIQGKKPVCIIFSAPVDNGTAQVLVAAVTNAINDGHDDIHLMISTPGGSVADGIMVYNVLSALPTHLTTYNVGTVDSIGNVIFMAGKARIALPTSRFMFHGVGFDIQAARFELKDINERKAGIENDQSMIADILVKHTALKKPEIEQLFLQAAFLRSDEAHKSGVVHEVRDVHMPQGIPIAQLVFQR